MPSPASAPSAGVRVRGNAAASGSAQPSERTTCAAAAAGSSRVARRSPGSNSVPAASDGSSSRPPVSRACSVEGAPLTTAATEPAARPSRSSSRNSLRSVTVKTRAWLGARGSSLRRARQLASSCLPERRGDGLLTHCAPPPTHELGTEVCHRVPPRLRIVGHRPLDSRAQPARQTGTGIFEWRHARLGRRRGCACRRLGVDTFAGRRTAQGVRRSHCQKPTTDRLPTSNIGGMAHWLLYFLWVGAVPVLVVLGRLTLALDA